MACPPAPESSIRLRSHDVPVYAGACACPPGAARRSHLQDGKSRIRKATIARGNAEGILDPVFSPGGRWANRKFNQKDLSQLRRDVAGLGTLNGLTAQGDTSLTARAGDPKSTGIRLITGRPHFREAIRQDRSRNRVRRRRLWPRGSGPSRFGGLLRACFRH